MLYLTAEYFNNQTKSWERPDLLEEFLDDDISIARNNLAAEANSRLVGYVDDFDLPGDKREMEFPHQEKLSLCRGNKEDMHKIITILIGVS